MNTTILKIRFSTSFFGLSGNRFDKLSRGGKPSGEDLAKWMIEGLPQHKLRSRMEPWGWLVYSRVEGQGVVEQHELRIYAPPPDDERDHDDDYGEWTLVLQTRHHKPWLHFFKRWEDGLFNETLGKEIIAELKDLGVDNLVANKVLVDASGNEKKEILYAF